ncbi:hypothetical protein SH139x_003158 [Planctomycetaceae bacterium SH139]
MANVLSVANPSSPPRHRRRSPAYFREKMPQRLSNVPLADLVPETKLWNDGRGIDLETFAAYHGSFELAIAFGELFWPAFFEFEHCVFRGTGPNEDFMKAYAHNMRFLKNDAQAVEVLHNHLHIWDLFPVGAGDPQPTRNQCLYLARLLRELWESKLSRDFPDRTFCVTVNEEGAAEAEGDYQLTFCQSR